MNNEPKQDLPEPPFPYTAEELERDNPYNAWLYENDDIERKVEAGEE